jgi:hypothetical protein
MRSTSSAHGWAENCRRYNITRYNLSAWKPARLEACTPSQPLTVKASRLPPLHVINQRKIVGDLILHDTIYQPGTLIRSAKFLAGQFSHKNQFTIRPNPIPTSTTPHCSRYNTRKLRSTRTCAQKIHSPTPKAEARAPRSASGKSRGRPPCSAEGDRCGRLPHQAICFCLRLSPGHSTQTSNRRNSQKRRVRSWRRHRSRP